MSSMEVTQIHLKTRQKSNAALFLALLLVLLASRPWFYFMTIGLIVGLAIGRAVLMAPKLAIGLLK